MGQSHDNDYKVSCFKKAKCLECVHEQQPLFSLMAIMDTVWKKSLKLNCLLLLASLSVIRRLIMVSNKTYQINSSKLRSRMFAYDSDFFF